MFEGRDLACVRGGRLVFAHLSFALERGESLVVSGPNGSGKSTLLRLLAGLLPARRGQLSFDGAAVTEDPEAFHRKLHYFGHLDATKPALTVAENLAFWIDLRGGDTSRLIPALEAFGIADLHDLPARVLSAGQRRRLGLARLVAVPAPLWLLDEPTIALDRESVMTLHNATAAHLAQGGMAVVATNVPMAIEGAARLELASFAPGEAEEILWA